MTGWSPLPLPAAGQTPVRVLTIAGSDSGGGAGLQSDLRTFALTGVHGLVAVTAVTVQNSVGVTGIARIEAELVAAQIDSVATDIGFSAAKTGMLASAPIIRAVAAAARRAGLGSDRVGGLPFVVDPVAASMRGNPLLKPCAEEALVNELFPLATIVTPNLDEVRLFTGIEVTGPATQRSAAEKLLEFGPRWALVKGGHLRSDPAATDLLLGRDGEVVSVSRPRVDTVHDHGGGDTLAAALACALAHGLDVPAALDYAKEWVTRSLAAAYPLGARHGPASPMWRLRAAPDPDR